MLLTRKTALLEKCAGFGKRKRWAKKIRKKALKAEKAKAKGKDAKADKLERKARAKLKALIDRESMRRRNLKLSAKTGKPPGSNIRDWARENYPELLKKAAAERVGGYKSNLSHDQIKERIKDIRSSDKGLTMRGSKKARSRDAKAHALFKDALGPDYINILKTDPRFKKTMHNWKGPFGLKGHAVREGGEWRERSIAIKSLEKAMKNKAMS